MLPTHLMKAFLQSQEREESTEEQCLSKLSPPVCICSQTIPAYSITWLQVSTYPRARPALHKIINIFNACFRSSIFQPSLPVCFPHSHCLYSESLMEQPIQAFQCQWMHHDFNELPKVNSNSAHYFSHLKVLPSITSPVSFWVSSKAASTESHK